jgi:putative salt-induced outer membrane protein YdiY
MRNAIRKLVMKNKGCNLFYLAAVFFLANLCLSEEVRAGKIEEVGAIAQNNSGSYDLNIAPENPARTAEILGEALEAANNIEDAQTRANFFSEIAERYSQIGRVEIALDVLSQALEIAETIEDAEGKARVLISIAFQYASWEQISLANEVFALAIEATDAIEDANKKAALLTEIALKYADIGQYELSSQLLSASEDLIVAASAPPVLFPFEPTPWQGGLGFNLNLSSDQNTTSLGTLTATLERVWPRNEFDAALSFTNDFDSTRQTDDESRFIGNFRTEYRHHFNANWQYFISNLVRRDDNDGIDIRTNLYTGPGLNIWRAGPDRSFDMQLGFGIRYEESNRRTDDFDFPVLQYRIGYKNILFENLKLRQFLIFELPVADTEDYYIESSTTLSVPISEGWSFDNSVNLRYSAIPTLDNPNFRVKLQTGLRYEF